MFFHFSPLVGEVDENGLVDAEQPCYPSLMGEVKNLMTLSLQMFFHSLLVGEVDENGVVDAEQPDPLPHG